MAEKMCKKCGSLELYQDSWNLCKDCLRRYRKALRRAKADVIQEYKERPCMDCGISYPYYVMDFDHVRGEKRFNVSSSYTSYSWADIIDEIAKCDVVCSNCHRIRTAKQEIKVRDDEDLSEWDNNWNYALGEAT